jgi:hypothetical protein
MFHPKCCGTSRLECETYSDGKKSVSPGAQNEALRIDPIGDGAFTIPEVCFAE